MIESEKLKLDFEIKKPRRQKRGFLLGKFSGVFQIRKRLRIWFLSISQNSETFRNLGENLCC